MMGVPLKTQFNQDAYCAFLLLLLIDYRVEVIYYVLIRTEVCNYGVRLNLHALFFLLEAFSFSFG